MPNDIFSIVDLAEEMHAESQYNHIKFNKKKLTNGLLVALANFSLVGFVDDKEKKIVGAVVGLVDTFLFSDDFFLQGKGFYVTQNYRKSKTGINLLREFISGGKKIGVKQISMDTACAADYNHLDPLFKKAGFKKVGSVQIMDF